MAGPPRYQVLVFPYPISISDAVLRALSLRDLQVPRIPLIFNSFETLIVRVQETGKGNKLSSVV